MTLPTINYQVKKNNKILDKYDNLQALNSYFGFFALFLSSNSKHHFS